jgi:hypothetical protein
VLLGAVIGGAVGYCCSCTALVVIVNADLVVLLVDQPLVAVLLRVTPAGTA